MSYVNSVTRRGFPFQIPLDRPEAESPEALKAVLDQIEQNTLELLRDLSDPVINTGSWEWTSKALKTLAGIYSFAPTVLVGALRPGVAGRVGSGPRAADFLLDTWKYIRTGRQIMNPRNWRDLMSFEGTPANHYPNQRDVAAAKELVIDELLNEANLHKLLSLWVSQSPTDGLEHLIQTTHVIFCR